MRDRNAKLGGFNTCRAVVFFFDADCQTALSWPSILIRSLAFRFSGHHPKGLPIQWLIVERMCIFGQDKVVDVEVAIPFCLEVAKAFGGSEYTFYDPWEFGQSVALYGSMKHLQTFGGSAATM